jgi:hypothetical protein
MNNNLHLKGTYKAKVKNCPEWRNKRICSLEISVGNPNQEGEKLLSLIQMVNKNFDVCLINLADTLQRHNLYTGDMDEAGSKMSALIEGNLYLMRNAEIIEQLRIPYQIIRWPNWQAHPDFDPVHEDVRAFYFLNEQFTQLVDEDAKKYLGRNQFSPEEYDARMQKSIDFILEEAAAHILMAREFSPVCLYPGKRMKSLDYIAQTTVPSSISGLGQSTYARVVLNRKADNQNEKQTSLSKLKKTTSYTKLNGPKF